MSASGQEERFRLKQLLELGIDGLEKAGIDNPRLDVRLLLQHVTGFDHADMISNNEIFVDEATCTAFHKLLSRREAFEPVHRIIGHREFFGLELSLSKQTLEPRADTEIIVETALDWLKNQSLSTLQILDLGTGTGAIAIALLKQIPTATAIATDISREALETAQRNASQHGCETRLKVMHGSWFSALKSHPESNGQFDLIVSNPPYIRSDELDGLQAEVVLHDPKAALDGGVDGLDAYRAILDGAASYLKPNGRLILEIGYDQKQALLTLANEYNANVVETVTDLAGRDRCVVVTFR